VRYLKTFLIVVVVLAGAVYLIGNRLPEEHTAQRDHIFAATPDRIYKEISTPNLYPKWRTGVQQVTMLSDSAGMPRFRESAMSGDVTYVVEHVVPNRQYVLTIADANLPYSGSWTFDLTPVAGGTQVSITEEGAVHNPMFRFMSRYVFGHLRTIDGYLGDLDRRLSNPTAE
jgi:uncharacterized protein YndB with AHSA1/START domain